MKRTIKVPIATLTTVIVLFVFTLFANKDSTKSELNQNESDFTYEQNLMPDYSASFIKLFYSAIIPWSYWLTRDFISDE